MLSISCQTKKTWRKFIHITIPLLVVYTHVNTHQHYCIITPASNSLLEIYPFFSPVQMHYSSYERWFMNELFEQTSSISGGTFSCLVIHASFCICIITKLPNPNTILKQLHTKHKHFLRQRQTRVCTHQLSPSAFTVYSPASSHHHPHFVVFIRYSTGSKRAGCSAAVVSFSSS